jgi:hypothetical protein
MVKRFFTVIASDSKHRVFLDDLKLMVKRIKKIRPQLPVFEEKHLPLNHISLCLSQEKSDESCTEEMGVDE